MRSADAEPCAPERVECVTRRAARERLLLVLWLSLAGTSLFVLGLVVHAYRLTSPLGSPRSFAAAGYTGLQFATPCTAAVALPHAGIDVQLDSPKARMDRLSREMANGPVE